MTPPVQNVYYMLSYAFKVLNKQGYKDIATEQFNNVAELCASILSNGISVLLKRGLGREYIPHSEALSSLRGKIDITESIKNLTFLEKKIICSYDDFSVNSYMNRILKTTLNLLLRADISKTRKKTLRKILVFFGEVELLEIYNINWSLHYNQNNQTYRMLISICYLVIKGLLQTQSNGNSRLMDFIDEQRMSTLFEKFILEYYRKEFPQITANPSQIPWQLDDDMNLMLPIMQTDIMLSKNDKILIIDAKYYSRTVQVHYNAHTLHSANLYQIFTYVKNKEAELTGKLHEVSGMLLYAKTDESIFPNNTYHMSGNRISARTLNLNCNFTNIAIQLNQIVEEYFDIKPSRNTSQRSSSVFQ